MLYHYTSAAALNSILHNSPSDRGICFWATRFDCFGDHKEYKLGVETIRRLLPRIEASLQPDRQVAHLFDWDEIYNNQSCFWPYVISYTSTFDNDYMWEEYADNSKGVVLALDDSRPIQLLNTTLFMIKSCLYLGKIDEESITKEIESEYFNAAFGMLQGPRQEVAFALLQNNPQFFVRLIALYLLSFVAPRIKDGKFHKEQETRAIISSPLPNTELLFQPPLAIEEQLVKYMELAKQMMANEKSRKRANGDVVFYKELYLPSSILTKIYVKDKSIVGDIHQILNDKGYKNIGVVLV